MRKSLGLLAALAVVFLAPAANAEKLYVGLIGGINITHDGNTSGGGTATYDLGVATGGYVGIHVKENFRLEGELSYRKNDIESVGGAPSTAEVETLAFMANAYFDFGTQSGFKPYIGGGLGFVDGDLTTAGGIFDATELAVQFIAGAGMPIATDILLTLEYRAFMTDNLSFGAGGGLNSIEYFNSAFVFGVRKTF